ncbi:hypothetical protein HMI54_015078 [Coelomomyces lativittatus]|nr:hypothetical protein HMI54_015078 [Coelomomyces lativittatus]KAJ1516544.1 hypothetical protein HMI55_001996 [Coelomomyces lativittatus]
MDSGMSDMSMVWNWQTRHFQVIFPWWHVHSTLDFILTLSVLMTLAIAWEYVQSLLGSMDMQRSRQLQKLEERYGRGAGPVEPAGLVDIETSEDSASRILIDRGENLSIPTFGHGSSTTTWKFWNSTLLYMISHALSIFLMLAFMTFNGYVILSNILGAGLGYYLFRKDSYMSSHLKHCCD